MLRKRTSRALICSCEAGWERQRPWLLPLAGAALATALTTVAEFWISDSEPIPSGDDPASADSPALSGESTTPGSDDAQASAGQRLAATLVAAFAAMTHALVDSFKPRAQSVGGN